MNFVRYAKGHSLPGVLQCPVLPGGIKGFFDRTCKGHMEDSVILGELIIEEKNNNDAGNRLDCPRFF